MIAVVATLASVESLPVMLGTLVICLVAAWLFGRALGIVGDLRTLIGVGTARGPIATSGLTGLTSRRRPLRSRRLRRR
ncbi:hypothetical protein BKD30_10165 [Tersicoccus phoenicis]|uniref:Uncharacterized protein n=1 Tax=Tersicoccus phoenicis TaxID=554083 RepID=A0A1R1L8W9_9MICC|nr:hypothetical protein [Tersicoccus phoenicis]OMH23972.1 hypothetical protein BKD30_10165 [Tersicoccus phoenicis]